MAIEIFRLLLGFNIAAAVLFSTLTIIIYMEISHTAGLVTKLLKVITIYSIVIAITSLAAGLLFLFKIHDLL